MYSRYSISQIDNHVCKLFFMTDICACVRVHESVCVCVCVRACVRACVRVFVHTSGIVYPYCGKQL